MFTKQQLAKWRSEGFVFPEFYDEVAVDEKKKEPKKPELAIVFASASEEGELYTVILTITCKNISGNAIINILNSETNSVVSSLFITLDNKSFSQKITFNKNSIIGFGGSAQGISLKANISSLGFVAETGLFKIGEVSNDLQCLCKKQKWTSDDLKFIVTQLRMLDVSKIDYNTKDKNGNREYKDKDGKVIPSTDSGKKPKNAVSRNKIIIDLSLFDDIASDQKKFQDRLFIKEDNGFNVNPKEANYISFSKYLNEVFEKYKINTCLRKIHFLTQTYAESARFNSTYENITGSSYFGGDFYQGRGIKQITHDYNYLEYYCFFKQIDLFEKYLKKRLNNNESVTEFNERTNNQYITITEMQNFKKFVSNISTDLFFACDSAGWYWWKNEINKYADEDNLIAVSAKVNNPSAIISESVKYINGYEDRKKFYDLIKIIFNYENCK
jgi:predicted chitinase